MADNLNIGVTADTSKARTEFDLLNAKMKVTQKEIKATADAAVKTGDPKAIANLKALNVQYDAMAKGQARLRREINASTTAAKAHGEAHKHGFYLVENSVQSLNGAFMALGHNLAGARAGIAGFVVGIGLKELIAQINEADQKLRDLRDLGRETGQKPLVAQAVQELAKETGESAETADKFLQGMGATLAKIATQAADAKTGVSGMFDQGVAVFRGGVTPPRDFSDPLAVLGSYAERLKKLAPEQQMKVLGDLFLRLEKNARSLGITEIQLNEISKSWFGVSAEAANNLIKANENLLAKQKELSAAQRGANAQHLKELKEVDTAYEELGKTIEDIWGGLRSSTAGGRAGLFGALNQFLKDNIELFSTWSKALGTAGGALKDFLGISRSEEGKVIPLPPVDVNAKALPQVFGGGATGVSVYNPQGEDVGGGYRLLYGGHGPYGQRVQSDTPGMSDYQAPPPQVVNPMLAAAQSAAEAAGSSKTAAEKAADAAASAQLAAEASKTAVDALSFKQNATIDAGLASGGMIHGPGSGTSDSITARLSNGEFVMSAAAVSRWGPSAMAALNGLRNPFGGGSLPRFAAGGLVGAAGGGTPVHLHLGGQSFVTNASEHVASAIVVASRREQMRSAGVKPSWYGGRPGA
jgi:hypothetical protein